MYVLGNWIHHNGGRCDPSEPRRLPTGRRPPRLDKRDPRPPGGPGIQVYDKNSGSIVVNNTVVRSGYSGIVIGGRGGVDGIRVHNNIFAFNDQWESSTTRTAQPRRSPTTT